MRDNGSGLASPGDNSEGYPAVACGSYFLRGTRLATTVGPVKVERLAIGDLVVLDDGGSRPIRWIGHRIYEADAQIHSPEVLPVRIKAGAIAEGVPLEELLVSPCHGIYLDGSLIHAGELVNGASIVEEIPVGVIEYFYVELARPDILLAEGLPVESCGGYEDRRAFINASDYYARYGSTARAVTPYPCAPLLNETSAGDALRSRLASRAGLPLPQTEAAGALLGFVDSIDRGVVRGWAMDAADRQRPVPLEVLIGETVIATVLADRYRPDLVATGATGRQGFKVMLPPVSANGYPIVVRRTFDHAVLDGLISPPPEVV